MTSKDGNTAPRTYLERIRAVGVQRPSSFVAALDTTHEPLVVHRNDGIPEVDLDAHGGALGASSPQEPLPAAEGVAMVVVRVRRHLFLVALDEQRTCEWVAPCRYVAQRASLHQASGGGGVKRCRTDAARGGQDVVPRVRVLPDEAFRAYVRQQHGQGRLTSMTEEEAMNRYRNIIADLLHLGVATDMVAAGAGTQGSADRAG
jgi:hypothetical protein